VAVAVAVLEDLSEEGEENNNQRYTSKKPYDYRHSFPSIVTAIITAAAITVARRIAVEHILCISHVAFAEINLAGHSSPAVVLEPLHGGIDAVAAI